MTRSQFERAKILQMRSREAELRLLAEGKEHADPRYVQDVVGFLWTKILQRKLALRDSLPEIEREHLETMLGNYQAA